MGDRTVRDQIEAMLDRADAVDYAIQLPETEFEVMEVIWGGEPPITTGYMMQRLGNEKGWRTPTLISFLRRLEERGFVASVKKGRDRYYFPLADRDTYLRVVTARFMQRYHKGSFTSVMDAIFPGKRLSEQDIEAFLAWLRNRY